MNRRSAPGGVIGALGMGMVALVSFASAPAIGANDGGTAYVIVFGTAVTLTLGAVCLLLLSLCALLDD